MFIRIFRVDTLASTAKKHRGRKKELRKAKRYPLRVPVTFWWERGDGISQEVRGTTLDISARGMFIACHLLPLPGVHLQVEVYLPSVNGIPNLVQLHGEGTVVRAGGKGSESGFAAETVFRTAKGSAGSIVLGTEDLIQ